MSQPDSVTPAEAAVALPTPSGRKRPAAIPWREIACRLAEGAKPSAVAADLGLQEERIWRHLRTSLRFRFYLRQAMERQRLLAGLQLSALGPAALLSRGLKPDSLDGDLLRLLNEATASDIPGADLAPQIERLGKTGDPPPNMAFRRRMAEERRQMDRQVEAWGIQDAARAAAERAIPPSAAAKPGEAARTAANAGEPVRSAANTSEAPRSVANTGEATRSAANTSEAPRTAAKPDETRPSLRLRWSRPPSPRPEPRRSSVVDPEPGIDPAQGGRLPDS